MEPRKAIERALICAAFQGSDEVDRIAATITDADITHPDMRMIWRAIKETATTSEIIDPVLVLETISKQGEVPQWLVLQTLTELSEARWESSHIDHYCKALIEYSSTDTANDIGRQLAAEDHIDQATIDSYIVKLDQLARGRSDEIKTAEDAVNGLEERRANPRAVHATGIKSIDNRIKGGLRDWQIVVIGGRPGAGKSVLLTQIAVGIADRGESALIVSLEMLKEEIVDRISKQRSLEAITGLPLLFIDSTSDLGTICSLARVASRRYKLGVIVVDYLQLAEVPHSKSDNRERQIATVSRRIKRLAMDLQVPIIVGSQLNRESQKRGRPTLADLRESGAIEQDADIVILLSKDEESNDTLIDIAKHRGGATGDFVLQLAGARFEFTESDSFSEYDRS